MSSKIPVLFDLLKSRGISQKQLSENTGISAGNISDWKSGKAAPSQGALSKIANYLDCSVDYLLGNTDSPQSLISDIDPQTAEALELFKALSSEQRDNVLGIMRGLSNK